MDFRVKPALPRHEAKIEAARRAAAVCRIEKPFQPSLNAPSRHRTLAAAIG